MSRAVTWMGKSFPFTAALLPDSGWTTMETLNTEVDLGTGMPD